MKNIFKLLPAGIFLFAVCVANPLKAQISQNPGDSLKSVPAEVQVILKKSCFGCHAEPGKKMALSRINFTKWNEYTSEKQASKAKAICKQVTKGKMPPKKFRESHPEAIPTADELKILCDWNETLQSSK